MILNETKPPLEEAVELAHYGVPGMKWGRRKDRNRPSLEDYDEYDALVEQERHERNKRIAAGSALAAVGVVATVAVLHKTGAVKINPELIAKGKEAASKLRESSEKERTRGKIPFNAAVGATKKAHARYKDSDFSKRTFEPDQVANPLWRTDKTKPKLSTSLADVLLGRGVHTIHTLNNDVWATPVGKKR